MKRIRNGLFLVMALTVLSFYFDSSTEVYAMENHSGETAKLNIEFRVYTDIADAEK